MHNIIYPADYFNLNKVDEMFEKEAMAFKNEGFNIQIWNGKPIESGTYIYRGWMLSEDEYNDLELFMNKNNSKLITDKMNYLNSHYLKNWYDKLSDLTPETVFSSYENINDTINSLDWNKFFVKDYVKSLTTEQGSIANSKDEVLKILKEIDSKKGIVGGISLRKVHDFVDESEIRYFCLNGKVLTPIGNVPSIVKTVADRIKIPFFSIDVIQDNKGKEWIVEIGDGQVSDLKLPWKPERFAIEIKKVLNNKIKYKP